jgi:hypothetical protein
MCRDSTHVHQTLDMLLYLLPLAMARMSERSHQTAHTAIKAYNTPACHTLEDVTGTDVLELEQM